MLVVVYVFRVKLIRYPATYRYLSKLAHDLKNFKSCRPTKYTNSEVWGTRYACQIFKMKEKELSSHLDQKNRIGFIL